MNVSTIQWGYRKIGPSYGLPVITIKAGYTKYEPEGLLIELQKIGLDIRTQVVLSGFSTGEKGLATLIEGFKICKVTVELECSGNEKMPAWFTRGDRWFVEWVKGGIFNYTGLRPKQDMLIYSGKDIDLFLKETVSIGALRGLIVSEPRAIFEKVRNMGVRVYSVN